MSQHTTSSKAFQFSLLAGLLILTNTLLLGAVTTWSPDFLPTLPGQTANDPAVLYQLTTLGLIFGLLVFLGAILLRMRPTRQKTWGSMIIICSIPSILTGGGFIIGVIIGILGGALALKQKN